MAVSWPIIVFTLPPHCAYSRAVDKLRDAVGAGGGILGVHPATDSIMMTFIQSLALQPFLLEI